MEYTQDLIIGATYKHEYENRNITIRIISKTQYHYSYELISGEDWSEPSFDVGSRFHKRLVLVGNLI